MGPGSLTPQLQRQRMGSQIGSRKSTQVGNTGDGTKHLGGTRESSTVPSGGAGVFDVLAIGRSGVDAEADEVGITLANH